MTETRPLTLGTAGHVDHGKTELVRALTGRDTDRLPEEKERGLSIELGYAPLELPSGRRLSVIDAPGHERFVRTMVAGSTGIDLFLLCVAADDGVMPQTREHLAVLRALEVTRGVAAVTKADLADPAPAARRLAELLPDVESVPVAAPRGDGLAELLAAVERAAAAVHPRAAADGPARLPVDRSFTLKGIGTVVTGTLWSGEVAVGDQLVLLPQERRVRVRSLEVHDARVERAAAGQRVALNLVGVGHREVRRGDVLCDGEAGLGPSFRIDAAVELDADASPVATGRRMHVHHGTREAPARVVPLDAARLEPGPRVLCQLRLEAPLIAARGDRLVLRRIAPPDTIGGGEVLDPEARRHGGRPEVLERLRALERGDPPPPPAEEARPGVEAPDFAGKREPEPVGASAVRLAEVLRADGERPRADGELEAAAGLESAAARVAWRQLERGGMAVRLGHNLHFAPDPLERLLAQIVKICDRDGGATIAGIRDELGTSRRYAQALLEHLDAMRVTVRRGDSHVLRRRADAR